MYGRISEAAKGLILESCLPLHPYHVLSGEAGSNNYLTDDTLMKATALAKKQFVYHSFVSQLIQSKIPFGYMTHPASRKVESLPSVPLIQNLESQPKLVVSPASLGLPRLIPLISDLYIYLEDDNDGSAETTEPSYTVSAKIRIRSKRVPLSSHVVVRNPHWTFYTENQSLSFRKEGFTDYVADILGFLRPTMKLARLAYQRKDPLMSHISKRSDSHSSKVKRKESAMKESLISIIDYQPSALDVSCRGSIFRVTCTSGSYQIVSKSQQKSHLALEKYLISAVKVLNQYENICSVFEV